MASLSRPLRLTYHDFRPDFFVTMCMVVARRGVENLVSPSALFKDIFQDPRWTRFAPPPPVPTGRRLGVSRASTNGSGDHRLSPFMCDCSDDVLTMFSIVLSPVRQESAVDRFTDPPESSDCSNHSTTGERIARR